MCCPVGRRGHPLRPTVKVLSGDRPTQSPPVRVPLRRVRPFDTTEGVGDAEHVLVVVPGDLLLGRQFIERLLERDALLLEATTEITRLRDEPVQRSNVGGRTHVDRPMLPLEVADDAPLGAVDLVAVRNELLGSPPHANTLPPARTLAGSCISSSFSYFCT